MATYTKAKLSGSTNGKGIKVVPTSTNHPTTTILHTAVSGTTNYDEVYLYAYNSHTANVVLTIEWGEATAPDGNIVVTIPYKSGRFLVVDGRLINNGLVICAFAATANVIIIDGYVNQIVN